jgi:hypothetical protein
VWLGNTEVSHFGKATLMNLANLGESKGAQEMYLILAKDHVEIKQFLRMFKVIDAKKVSTACAKKDLTLEAVPLTDVTFYKIDL